MASLETGTRTLRYLDGLAYVRADGEAGETRVLEVAMPQGAMTPLHVHDEDETIFVLEGRMTFYVGVDVVSVSAGGCFVAPRGLPHTYRVDSAEGARWQVVTTHGRYERFVDTVAVSADADADELAAPAPFGVREAVAVTAAAARNGIEILAPAGVLPSDL
jgi:quercetin dioxygenase-like cupin family protein